MNNVGDGIQTVVPNRCVTAAAMKPFRKAAMAAAHAYGAQSSPQHTTVATLTAVSAAAANPYNTTKNHSTNRRTS